MKRLFMLLAAGMFLFACNNKEDDKNGDDKGTATVSSTGDKKPAMEVMDISTGDLVKKSYMAFSNKDIDAMTADYADDIMYRWSAGDSLAGKAAVVDFWKKRMSIIDSLQFTEHIVAPLQVNEQQSQYAPTGKWILHWAMCHVKYKNGKKLDFWVHSVNHLNDAGKVDFIGMYYDRAPVMEATRGLAVQ